MTTFLGLIFISGAITLVLLVVLDVSVEDTVILLALFLSITIILSGAGVSYGQDILKENKILKERLIRAGLATCTPAIEYKEFRLLEAEKE